MKIVFRADASLQIGTGHLIRCLALADALREEGADVHFVFRTQPRFKDEIVTNSGHYLHFLSTPESSHGASGLANADDCPIHAEWLGVRWEQDAEECAAVLKSIGRPDWLVVDHYALDARWEESLCGSVGRIMVIDDLADRKHDCDVLLDQTLAANEVNYRTLVPRACRLLLGPEYALLRPQFAACRVEAEARRKKNQEIRRILVAMGGLDCINSTSTVLRGLALLQSHDLEVTVILGSLAPHVDKVMRLAEKTPFSAHVLTDVRNMAVLMVEHDVCVGSAGMTTWERCCLGLPSILLVCAANQLSIAQAMSDEGAGYYLGWAQEIVPENVRDAVNGLSRNQEIWHRMAETSFKICDGLGTERVTQLLAGIS